MLLTIRTTRRPATDLGYLLHKHPERVQQFDLPFGAVHVFYPEAGEDACTAALLLEIDAIGLVRGGRDSDAVGPLARYVNDRPYVASSFLSVAIARVFGSALNGNCAKFPELVTTPMPLEIGLPVLPARGRPGFVEQLFEPLGYDVMQKSISEDVGPYVDLRLSIEAPLQAVLAHLYVLIPVLDNDKHYYIGPAEVRKLLKHGEGWLDEHPLREEIAYRYLRRQRSLAREALDRLAEGAESEAVDGRKDDVEATTTDEEPLEKPIRLNERRMKIVHETLKRLGVKRVLDLGCGEGKLVRRLLRDRQFSRVVGLDTSIAALERAALKLHLEEMAPKMRERVDLWHGSLTYRDRRFEDFDAATLVEVIEHVDESRLVALERVVFERAKLPFVLVSTPNREYNACFESMPAGSLRHRDHRFEWTRAEFRAWADAVCARHGYTVDFEAIGDEHEEHGPPTQMAIFRREGVA